MDNYEALLKGVTWQVAPEMNEPGMDNLPYVTHQGEGEMLGVKFRCYRLNDGRAVIHGDDMQAILTRLFGDHGGVK